MTGEAVSETLRSISERVHGEMSEAEVETAFLNEDFFEPFGYEGAGYDLRSKWSLPDNRRPDFATYGDNQQVIAVYEFKEPEEDIEAHVAQAEDYSTTLRSNFAILTNGVEMAVYRRSGPDHSKIGETIRFEDATEEDGTWLYNLLKKPEWDITDLSRVREYLSTLEPINLNTELGREDFFQTFQLGEHTVFGEFVAAARDLLQELRDNRDNPFVKGAYQFWDTSYSSTPSSLPSSWEPFFEESSLREIDDSELKDFMFCLETGHALLSRLLLEKAVEDYEFFPDHMDIGIDGYFDEISGFSGQINPDSYPALTTGFFEDMEDILIESLFEDDIYIWWKDGFPEHFATLHQSPQTRFGSIATEGVDGSVDIAARNRFSKATADILFSVRKFDFTGTEGDPLGDLYQRYFDRETRKALGEFYTPQPVVRYILDEIGYEPTGRAIHSSKLIDPACGSGTFLVDALISYIEDVERFQEDPDWERHLHELCINPQLVGLDIHPFAVLMAQIRFTVEILPYYKEAKMQNDAFTIHRLPIFRTDSLENEREGSDIAIDASGDANWTLTSVEENGLTIEVRLPYELEDGEQLTVEIELPLKGELQREFDVQNEEEYFAILQGMLDSVKEHMKFYRDPSTPGGDWEYQGGVESSIDKYLLRDIDLDGEFFEPYVRVMLGEVQTLDQEYGDGRLFKIFEDKVLGIVVKNFMEYDYVVGNPPYVRTQVLPADQRTYFDTLYEATSGNYDIYCLFLERGLDWLNPQHGKLCYITSNQFLSAKYGESTASDEGIRKNITKRSNIQKVFDFRDAEVFEDAANLPVIIHLTLEPDINTREDNTIRCIRVKSNIDDDVEGVDEQIIDLVRRKEDQPGYSDDFIGVFDYPQDELDEKFWTFMPPEEKEIFEKLDQVSNNKLKHITEDGELIHSGTQTSENDVFLVIPQDTHMIQPEDRGGIVRIQPTGYDEVVPIEEDLLRPWLKGDDVRRWQGEWSGQHVIFPYEFNDSAGEYEVLDQSQLQELEHTWDYLTSKEDVLRGREGGKWEGSEVWWEYGRPQNLEKLPNPKLICRDMSETSRFMLDEEGKWFFKTPYGLQFIPQHQSDTLELACVLNSKTLEFYLKQIAAMLLTGKYRYQTRYLKELPVIIPDTQEFSGVHEIVDTLVDSKDRQNKSKRFPEAYLDQVEGDFETIRYEWNTPRKPVDPDMAIIQQRADGTFKIEIGRTDEIISPHMDTSIRARYVHASVTQRNVDRNEVTEIPIPREDEEVAELLGALQDDGEFFEDVQARRPELETRINEMVYDLFELGEDEKEVIEEYVDTF